MEFANFSVAEQEGRKRGRIPARPKIELSHHSQAVGMCLFTRTRPHLKAKFWSHSSVNSIQIQPLSFPPSYRNFGTSIPPLPSPLYLRAHFPPCPETTPFLPPARCLPSSLPAHLLSADSGLASNLHAAPSDCAPSIAAHILAAEKAALLGPFASAGRTGIPPAGQFG